MRLFNLIKSISVTALTLSALAFSACKPEEKIEKPEAAIEITPAYLEFDYHAQEAEVTVESSEDWTLIGEHDWVTPSTVQGNNGSKVTFTAIPNAKGMARAASFKFAVTGKEKELTITQNGGEFEMIMTLTAAACGETDITLALELESKDLVLFNKWGIIYSLTDNKDEGEEIELEGAPVEGSKEVTVTGLETDKTYYFWSYAEDFAGNRYYTETPAEASTESIKTETGDGANNTFHIGKSYNNTRWFNGAMSEVRIWSRALSADEINAAGHFYGVDPSTAQGLVAYWKLNGTGTHVEDYSGNGHHGTAEKAF